MKMEVKYDSDDDTSVDLEVQTEESDTTVSVIFLFIQLKAWWYSELCFCLPSQQFEFGYQLRREFSLTTIGY